MINFDLLFIGGVPGAGKSTIAKAVVRILTDQGKPVRHYETDSFFYNEAGEYQFDREKLGEYHERNVTRTIEALQLGFKVIVSNTSMEAWEIIKYLDRLPDTVREVAIYHLPVPLVNRSAHCPDEAMTKMRNKAGNYIRFIEDLCDYKDKHPTFGIGFYSSLDELWFGRESEYPR